MPGGRVTPAEEERIVKEPARNKAALWFVWFGGGIAWSLYHVIGYAIASVGCAEGAVNIVPIVVLALTLVLAVAALAAALVARRERQPGNAGEEAEGDRGVRAFSSLAGV